MRYFGYILIFFGFSYTGYRIYLSKKRSLERLSGLICLVRYIKSRIYSFNEDLYKIYSSFENTDLEKYGFLDKVRKSGFDEAVNEYDNIFPLDDFEKSALKDFSSSLGKNTLDEEISSCDYLIDLLEKKEDSCKKSLPNEYRLFCGMGMLFGITVIILLL